MARLMSEDADCPSMLTISITSERMLPDLGSQKQRWQNLNLSLTSGKRAVSTVEDEDTAVCRTPTDEMKSLVTELTALADEAKELVLFEPSEPSFELTFARTNRGGIRVEAWLDAGNGTTGIYTWDACGIRFITTIEKLRAFIEELRSEFKPVID